MKLVSYHSQPGFFWFRILGYGLKVKHKQHNLTFSERYGLTKYLTIGNYYIGWLK